MTPAKLEERLRLLARDGVTVTIVDTAGGETAATNSAIRYADLCLIPTRPSIADIEATAATLRVDPRLAQAVRLCPEPDPDPGRGAPCRR